MNMTNKDNHTDLSSIREEYSLRTLDESDISPDPIEQFKTWMSEAVESKVNEPNAMALGTVTENSRPCVRIVLLKGLIDGQFRFFTNYSSNKGKQMDSNPNVSLTFFWPELERQVRIEGIVSKISSEDSNAYFSSRPIGSQIGAWASPQSELIKSRKVIEEQEKSISKKYEDSKIPRPSFWGGYNVTPDMIEFWQGRKSRLHDRLLFRKEENIWKVSRLAP